MFFVVRLFLSCGLLAGGKWEPWADSESDWTELTFPLSQHYSASSLHLLRLITPQLIAEQTGPHHTCSPPQWKESISKINSSGRFALICFNLFLSSGNWVWPPSRVVMENESIFQVIVMTSRKPDILSLKGTVLFYFCCVSDKETSKYLPGHMIW